MVIGIIGENCAGKSTLADRIQCVFDAEVISGNDYLRMNDENRRKEKESEEQKHAEY